MELHADAAAHQIRINTLHVSDYSDPRWMSFIGSFGVDALGRSDQYQIIRGSNDKELQLVLKPQYKSDNSLEHLMPKLQSLRTSLAKNNNPVFHVLVLYEPEQSILHAKQSKSAGKWIAAYEPIVQEEGAKECRFTEIERDDAISTGPLPANAIAYLLSFQRVSSLSEATGERDYLYRLADWSSLIKESFPEPEDSRGLNQREAIVRPIPQILGPIEWNQNTAVELDHMRKDT